MVQLLKCTLLLQRTQVLFPASMVTLHGHGHLLACTIDTHSYEWLKKEEKETVEAERIAQWLKVLADLPEDLDSQNPKVGSQSSSRGYKAFLCTPWVPDIHTGKM